MSTKERPADGICVFVPDESSIVTVASGEPFAVEVENGRRVVYLRPDDARRLLNSGLECCIPWREANMALAEAIGAPPKLEPGIAIGRLQHAAWEASRPRTILEDLAEMRAELHGWRR
jgi:hypothetical protein